MVAKPHLSDTDTINSVSLKGALEHCFCLDNNTHRKKKPRDMWCKLEGSGGSKWLSSKTNISWSKEDHTALHSFK